MTSCGDCKHSRINNGTGYWCIYSENDECQNYELFELFVKRPSDVPHSTEHCESMYPDVDDIPDGLCRRCGLNRSGGACGHVPKKREDPVIITTSCFYTPETNDGMRETDPIILSIEGE